MTSQSNLEALIAPYADKEAAELRARMPLATVTFEQRFYVDPDPDGVTFWVRDMTGAFTDEPCGGKEVAEETRNAWIIHCLRGLLTARRVEK
jgi:hypothetical protein